MNIVLYFFVRY